MEGPQFLLEPPHWLDFTNSTGAIIDCKATGVPQPTISWLDAIDNRVTDIPGLRSNLSHYIQPRKPLLDYPVIKLCKSGSSTSRISYWSAEFKKEEQFPSPKNSFPLKNPGRRTDNNFSLQIRTLHLLEPQCSITNKWHLLANKKKLNFCWKLVVELIPRRWLIPQVNTLYRQETLTSSKSRKENRWTSERSISISKTRVCTGRHDPIIDCDPLFIEMWVHEQTVCYLRYAGSCRITKKLRIHAYSKFCPHTKLSPSWVWTWKPIILPPTLS
ncbi:unnamed protein product, partial [Nesidiocoris tenuis]